MSERVNVRVLLLIGDQAEIVADVPAEERADPERYPVSEVAESTGLDVSELPGKRLSAAVDDRGRLTGWALA